MNIDGPAGALQAHYEVAENCRQITAILCHPHPQYGGSMSDAVLDTASQVLLAHGVDCLRFNFRGVGGSAGRYDNGEGETQDLLAVSAWLTSEHPAHNQWWLGYSFGSSIVWRALAQLQRETVSAAGPQRAILIAPPVGMMEFSGIELALPVDAIAGDRDDFVDSSKLMALEGVSAHLIPGADHFFSGQHGELAEQLSSTLR